MRLGVKLYAIQIQTHCVLSCTFSMSALSAGVVVSSTYSSECTECDIYCWCTECDVLHVLHHWLYSTLSAMRYEY